MIDITTQTDLSTTALVVVDMQSDFGDPQGSLFVQGAPAIIDRVNAAIDLVRARGGLIVYTADWHPAHTPHFAADGGIWPVHCVADTFGSRFLDGLRGKPDEIIRKGVDGEDGYSGFTVRNSDGSTSVTSLDAILRDRGVTEVIVCGLATDYCVVATALDARALGYQTILLTDAIAAVDLTPGDGDRAIASMAEAGVGMETVG